MAQGVIPVTMMSAMPSDPLPTIDANGAKLVPGMRVRILTIPEWLTHDLPDEDVVRLKEVEGGHANR